MIYQDISNEETENNPPAVNCLFEIQYNNRNENFFTFTTFEGSPGLMVRESDLYVKMYTFQADL